MPPKAGKEKAPPVQVVEEEEEPVLAVILADSFNSRFKPLSIHKPRTLLPLCNTPLLDWSLEALVSSGIQTIYVFCCSHAEQIKEAIAASRWSLPNSGVRIVPVVTPEARSVGDVLRELDAKQIITSDFVLVTGDIVSTLPIMDVVREHRKRRKISKDCIMTTIMKPCKTSDRLRPGVDVPVLLLDDASSEILHYQYVQAGESTVGLPREKISSKTSGLDLTVRIDLIDCSIDVCSVDVPALFTENFDYQDLRVDFVHGVLTSDILGKKIHCHIPKLGYSARVKDTKSFGAITHDVLSRRTFPLVPDDTPAYKGLRNNVYLSRDVDLARSAKLGRSTQIGPDSKISEEANISRSVVGTRCIIGKKAIITNSILFNNVIIGDGSVLTDAIVSNNVTIPAGCLIGRGAILGEGVTLGTDARVPEFWKIARVSPKSVHEDGGHDEDSDEETGKSEGKEVEADEWLIRDDAITGKGGIPLYKWPSEGEELVKADDSDNEAEKESVSSRRFNRFGRHPSEIDKLETSSVATLTPPPTPPSAAVPTLSLTDESASHSQAEDSSSEDDDASSVEADTVSGSSEEGGPAAEDSEETEFRNECRASLDRALEEGHTISNAAIELKTLRMAANASLSVVHEVIVEFLVGKIKLVPDNAAQGKEVVEMIKRWGGLIPAAGGDPPIETILKLQRYCATHSDRTKLFGRTLQAFYTEDIVEDDNIGKWLLDPRSKVSPSSEHLEATQQCRNVGLQLLRALQEESSDEGDDDEDGE